MTGLVDKLHVVHLLYKIFWIQSMHCNQWIICIASLKPLAKT